ncbi:MULTISPECIES: MgtC/SapB family protein [Cyanophyceae]|uniref:MgtC/SapB family protein n=1 Tax=Cyanophyceae TaxID=3028117 RepID=UPI001687C8A1|nr:MULTISPECIES: MgtC/SapB family protein [Cyanophyceae]MBD1915058.1 MgtC/SapB family protein [Phormidium sp. FACHB-77]MBD2030804.1 MgtC/SapB family protein [Phormidium sp. FACHB-322]MBD2053158.1 MgtC/SapB family protein [Leptolyngbya sp. FACHB-60]
MTPLSPISWIDVTGRLAVAVALGAVIGVDRQFSRKAAGLRTNMLVSLGAALFVLVTIQSGMAQVDNSAMGRILQGIITGVGFVGAGTIFREDRVRGLTSATAIWVSAGTGIAAGLGLWQLGLLGTGFALIILRLMKFAEGRVQQPQPPHY